MNEEVCRLLIFLVPAGICMTALVWYLTQRIDILLQVWKIQRLAKKNKEKT